MTIIGYLYSTVGFIVVFSYMPQILKLVKAITNCKEISLFSWWIWNYTSVISLLYSIFDLGDLKLSIVNLINVICINAIIAITLYKRRKYSPPKTEKITSA